MYRLLRTTGAHQDFLSLVQLLDEELARIDGEEHAFYHQYNGVVNIHHAVVFYKGNEPVACGAIKAFEKDIMEVKRMYTLPQYRGQGLAGKVLSALEAWAQELGNRRTVLETGKRQPDAVALYTKHGYRIIPNYGQYAGKENSVCFEKQLSVINR